MNLKGQKSDFQIELLRICKIIIDSYQCKGFLRTEGILPIISTFELISIYILLIKNQKDILNPKDIEKELIQKFSKLNYSPNKRKNKWAIHIALLVEVNYSEDKLFKELIVSINLLLENIIDREIKRKSYIESRITYLRGDYGYHYPTSFKGYKAMVALYQKKCKDEGKVIVKQSESALRDRYNEIKLKDNRDKKYDINFKNDFFIADWQFIHKIKQIIERITNEDEYCDWRLNYPHLSTFKKYKKFLSDRFKYDYYEVDENDYDKINEELSRDGLSSFYEGFSEDYLGLD